MLRIKSIRSLIKLTGCVGVLLVLFVSTALPGDPNAADYSTDNDRIFWFILVSDTHIGARGSQDSNNLKWIVTEGMNVVQPEFVVLAGDLTDSTNGNWFGYPNGPYQQEWDEYKSILAQGNVNLITFMTFLATTMHTATSISGIIWPTRYKASLPVPPRFPGPESSILVIIIF
jgi:hypothetical protein